MVQIKNRRVLMRLMVIQGVSQRQLAEAAGWSSHSYVGRLLRGEQTGVEPAPARRIARRLGVDVRDLFVP